MKIPSILSGVAGEYFVAAELSRRGYIASISLRNTRGIDILVTNQEARSITIQCKTRQDAGKSWMMTAKIGDIVSDTHFYVFVALGKKTDRPIYHIVPSCVVADHLKKSAKNKVGHFTDLAGKWEDKWELLEL